MTGESILTARIRSILPLALFSAYILGFVFEGMAFYSMAGYYGADSTHMVMAAVACQCLGLAGGGALVKNYRMAKRFMLGGMAVCFVFTCVFFFPPSWMWTPAMMVCSIASGTVGGAWGTLLKAHTPSGQRIKSCADVMIYSNILMIAVNSAAVQLSPFVGLAFALALVAAAMVSMAALPAEDTGPAVQPAAEKPAVSIRAPLAALALFVAVITVNSGLMYQIIIPAYDHLTSLTSWYWAVPYIIALIIMRNLSTGRPQALYLGMGMIVAAFLFFMVLDRSAVSYLAVDTLMLGACGIYDLFWWSILGEMLDLSERPSRVYGIGLASNVFGILIGKLLALALDALGLPASHVTVAALTVVCVTLALLPALNRRLSALLKNHAYLAALSAMPGPEQQGHMLAAPAVEQLTTREREILLESLSGKSIKDLAGELSISENTVKYHLQNIYSKYGVRSRIELVNMLYEVQILQQNFPDKQQIMPEK